MSLPSKHANYYITCAQKESTPNHQPEIALHTAATRGQPYQPVYTDPLELGNTRQAQQAYAFLVITVVVNRVAIPLRSVCPHEPTPRAEAI